MGPHARAGRTLVAVAITTTASACGLGLVGSLDAEDAPNGANTSPTQPAGADGASVTLSADGEASPTDATVLPDATDGPRVDAADATTVTPGPCAACGPGAAQTMCIANACVPARRVFLSSAASTANLGGIAGADIRCQNLATAANLGGTWRAWVSSSASSPSTRFIRATVPYRLLDGTTLATGWDDLTNGSILHGIDRDERGALAPATEVWTATTSSGEFEGGGCNGFTSGANGSPTAAQGISDRTNGQWTNVYVQFCDRTNPRIYCFEQ